MQHPIRIDNPRQILARSWFIARERGEFVIRPVVRGEPLPPGHRVTLPIPSTYPDHVTIED